MSLLWRQDPIFSSDPFFEPIEHLASSALMAPIWRGVRPTGDRRNMPITISESQDQLKLLADLPGCTMQDIKLTADEGQLKIEVERKRCKDMDQDKILREETYYGSLQRNLSIPDYVDANTIQAKFCNGCLHVTMNKLPVKQLQQPTFIPIQSG